MKRFGVIILICVLLIIIGLWYSWPLVKYFNTGMPYSHAPYPEYKVAPLIQGDYLQFYYYFWIFKDSVLGNTTIFTNIYEFNTGEFINKFSFQSVPVSLLFFVLSVFGNIAGYNLMVIATFILSGLFMYLLTKYYTGSYTAGIIAGLIFALAPYRLCQVFSGHPGGFTVWMVPLMIYLLELSFDKKSITLSLLSGLCIVSLGLLESHLAYYMFYFMAVFLPFRIYIVDKNIVSKVKTNFSEFLKAPENYKYIFIMFILGFFLLTFAWMYYVRRPYTKLIYIQLILVYPLFFCFWIIYCKIVAFISRLDFNKVLKQDVFTYLPIVLLPVYLVQYKYDIPSFGKYLVLIVVMSVLLLKAVFLLRYIDRVYVFLKTAVLNLKKYLRTLIPVLSCMFLYVGWVLWDKFTRLDVSRVASGRTLQEVKLYCPSLADIFSRFNPVGERFIYIGIVPAILFIMALWRMDTKRRAYILFYAVLFIFAYILTLGLAFDEVLPLYRLFYYIVPGFHYSRVPARIIYISFLALSILAGFGIKKSRRWLEVIAAVLIIIDFKPQGPPGISILPKENKVYQYVKDTGYKGNIMEIPIWPGDSSWSSIYQYYVTLYRIQMINGYDPTVSQDYVDNVAEALFSVNLGQIYYKQYKRLKELDVKYIILHEEAYPEKVCPFPPEFARKLLMKSPYLDFVLTDGNLYLFKVKDNALNSDAVLNYIDNTNVIYNLYEAEWLPRMTGEVIQLEEASNRMVVYGNKDSDKEGFLSFGPYRTYPIGRYVAVFRMMTDDVEIDKSIVRLEITSDNGNKILVSKDIKGIDFKQKAQFMDFTVPFTLEENKTVEFRIHYYGTVDIWIDCIVVCFKDQLRTRDNFEAEDLIRETGRIVQDAFASGGRAVFGEAKNDIAVRLAQGPYRTFTPGNYKVSFRLKVDTDILEIGADCPVVLLQAAADFGKREYIRKLVMLSEFKEKNKYQEFVLPFYLDLGRELDFRVTYKDNVDLWVDKVEVRRIKD